MSRTVHSFKEHADFMRNTVLWVTRALGEMIRRGATGDRYGIVFAIYRQIPHTTPRLLGIFSAGLVAPEKVYTFVDFAQEKVHRLTQHPGHRSSFQSRNLRAEKYAGAIAAGNYYLVVSGLSNDLADEAIAIVAAYKLDLLNLEQAAHLARKNRLCEKVLAAMRTGLRLPRYETKAFS